jgi:hypothetical protein
MPLVESFGEFTLKATSVKPIDLGGGQTRIEITFAGEVSGQVRPALRDHNCDCRR